MKIILLKDVPKVGRKYDVKDVADGYALNLLVPRGLAMVATAGAIQKINAEKEKDMTERKIQEDLLIKNLDIVKNTPITIVGKANDKGHLFAGITKEMLVAEILKSTRLNFNPDFIKLDKPIKELGEHKVTVEAMGRKVQCSVMIKAE